MQRHELVQHHIRHQIKAQLLAASVAEVDLLPNELKPLAERFIDLLNERILRDRAFWQLPKLARLNRNG